MWKSIEDAPKDGTMFIAREGDFTATAFYLPNLNYNKVKSHILWVLGSPGRGRCGAGKWFKPTLYMDLLPPPKETPNGHSKGKNTDSPASG